MRPRSYQFAWAKRQKGGENQIASIGLLHGNCHLIHFVLMMTVDTKGWSSEIRGLVKAGKAGLLRDTLKVSGVPSKRFAEIVDKDKSQISNWVNGKTGIPRHIMYEAQFDLKARPETLRIWDTLCIIEETRERCVSALSKSQIKQKIQPIDFLEEVFDGIEGAYNSRRHLSLDQELRHVSNVHVSAMLTVRKIASIFSVAGGDDEFLTADNIGSSLRNPMNVVFEKVFRNLEQSSAQFPRDVAEQIRLHLIDSASMQPQDLIESKIVCHATHLLSRVGDRTASSRVEDGLRSSNPYIKLSSIQSAVLYGNGRIDTEALAVGIMNAKGSPEGIDNLMSRFEVEHFGNLLDAAKHVGVKSLMAQTCEEMMFRRAQFAALVDGLKATPWDGELHKLLTLMSIDVESRRTIPVVDREIERLSTSQYEPNKK